MKKTDLLKKLQLFREAEDSVVDILKELDAEYEYMDVPTQIEVAKLAKLKRIADALEGINGALINMGGDIEALGDCVEVIPARYTQGIDLHFLRIGGSVDTGV